MKRNSKTCPTFTRKHRKQLRKLKGVKLTDDTKAYLKSVAKEMSRQEYPDLGVRFYCKACSQSWERSYDNTVVYCRECLYRDSCLKDITDFQVCARCL